MEFFTKEVDALLPPKLGESSTNKPKEEWQDEVFMRFSKFVKGGGCKESFTALEDCFEETQSILRECNQYIPVLLKCMVAHSRYYQPIVVVAKTAMEEIPFKDAEELAKRKQAEKLNQLAERKQAKG